MKLLLLIFRYLIDFTWANLLLAKQLLTPGLKLEPQVIRLETKVESPLEVLALSNMITFTPGTLTLDLQPGKEITVHVLSDGEKVAKMIKERLEQPLLEITRKS